MFVITADQINSRHTPDVVDATIRGLSPVLGASLQLPIDRTAGDEIQMLIREPDHALNAILFLCRDGRWSVGCGLGTVNTPLPANAREASGDAFVSARDAVTAAKKRETRFALRAVAAPTEAADAEALIDLLLQIRGRRSAEGWAIFDLLAAGLTQTEAAKRLGITPQAASKRARTAAVRAEFAARPPLERKLASANESTEERTES